MRVIVCGSRNIGEQERGEKLVLDELDSLFDSWKETGDFVVVHGGCRGPDLLASVWCDSSPFTAARLIVNESHPADWDRHGKAAGPIRNLEMARLGADLCLAFWNGTSSGTADMIAKAVQHGIPVRIVPWVKP